MGVMHQRQMEQFEDDQEELAEQLKGFYTISKKKDTLFNKGFNKMFNKIFIKFSKKMSKNFLNNLLIFIH